MDEKRGAPEDNRIERPDNQKVADIGCTRLVNIKFIEQLNEAVGDPESSIGSKNGITEIIPFSLLLEAGY